ncbi:hypothetical protein ADICYQ_3964 [Cyclobacterium qasimii M12-11B]|uniref:Uncharacterized protein n=1 Tax=Cyclobacterium qasimii M12-11B TaxID=641524 RepID=S7WK51_9BACT|nr:hypothetical protein ADICYQ_3964 [Cyclobacterium qasimii M12-11B]
MSLPICRIGTGEVANLKVILIGNRLPIEYLGLKLVFNN